jgi:hypothetical protein
MHMGRQCTQLLHQGQVLGDVDPHEDVGHPYCASNVTDVAKVEAGCILYLKVETEGDGEQDEQEVDRVHDVGTKNGYENEILRNVMYIFI